MLQKISTLEKEITEKVAGLESKLAVPQLANKLSLLEQKIQQQNTELQELRAAMKTEFDKPDTRDTIAAVDDKVAKLVATVEKSRTDSHHLRDCVQGAVIQQLQEDQDEHEDIKRRSANIIIHGLQEVNGEDGDARKKAEEDQLTDVMHVIRCDDVSIQSLTRLGARSDRVPT